MDAPLDLGRLSREELIALVLRQREQTRRGAAGRAGTTRRCGEVFPADGDSETQARSARWRASTGAKVPHAAGARLRSAADATHGEPGSCRCAVPILHDGAGWRDDHTHVQGHRTDSGVGGGEDPRLRRAAVPGQPGPEAVAMIRAAIRARLVV